MNYKTCKIINDKFDLDAKFNVFLKSTKKVQVTDGLEKGYIYAALFFYDEVTREIKKLEKIVRKQIEAVETETAITDTPIFLLEVSRRVQHAIGDDSLDALIKETIGETKQHICLAPEQKEIDKWESIKQSILEETMVNLHQTVIINSEKNDAGIHIVQLADVYIKRLTDRQKKLLSPALKMVGYLNDVRLDEFELKDFVATFRVYATAKPFKATEDAIKASLKKLMETNT
jgi:hypothetical protein